MVASEIRTVRPLRSLVVPMYNEAERIARTLEAMSASELAQGRYELLLVDDGSLDGTADIAEKSAAELGLANVRVIRSALNCGKGAAVRAGMLAAQGESRVFADADLSAGIPDIIACFELLESGAGDVVYASRAHPQSRITNGQPGHRVMTGRVFNLILRLLRLTQERDTQCGLKGFTAEAADRIFAAVTIEGFAFDVEVLALAHREGFRVSDMPIAWAHVDASRVRPVRDGAAMLRDVLALQRAIRRAGPALPSSREPRRMAVEKFEIMARLEQEHWWFRTKRELVAHQLAVHHRGGGIGFDAGCGTGATLGVLGRFTDVSIGAELDGHAASLAARDAVGGARVVVARAEALPLASGAVSCLTSLDVIEHLEDDVAALREYRRALDAEGLLVLTVPAYRWAWSRHDEVLGHRRRYTRTDLEGVAEAAGFEVLRATYFHSWLAPLALIVRKTPIRHLVSGDEEEISYVRPSVNRMLYLLASLERGWLRRAALPFGLSILLVGRPADGRAHRG